MGVELNVAEVAIPIDRAPDWGAAERALDFLELRTFWDGDGLIDDMFYEAEQEVGEELEVHDPRAVYWALCGLRRYMDDQLATVRATIEGLDPAEVAVIEAGGLRIYLSGGPTGGDPPTETVYPMLDLAEANILQQAGFSHVTRSSSDDPSLRRITEISDEDMVTVRATEALRTAELTAGGMLPEPGAPLDAARLPAELGAALGSVEQAAKEGVARFSCALLELAQAGLVAMARVRAQRDSVSAAQALDTQAVETLEVLEPRSGAKQLEPTTIAGWVEDIREQAVDALERLDVLADETGEQDYAQYLREGFGTLEDAVIAQTVGLVLSPALRAIGQLNPDGLEALRSAHVDASPRPSESIEPSVLGGPGQARGLSWAVIDRGRTPDWQRAEAALAEDGELRGLGGPAWSPHLRGALLDVGGQLTPDLARRQLAEDLRELRGAMKRYADGGYHRYVNAEDIGELTLWIMGGASREVDFWAPAVRLTQAGVLQAAGFRSGRVDAGSEA